MRTYSPKAGEIKREWFVVDAQGKRLGRVATEIARILRGKHKPIFTPHMDTGDYVIVINCDKIDLAAGRLDEKMYYRHSMYPGGFKEVTLRNQMTKHPERVIESAVRGMLPHNKLGRAMIKKMKVYAGEKHPHQAQQPKVLEI